MKKLLVCIDGSLYGQTCCQYAAWFSQKNSATVDALYVSELWQYEAPLIADFGGSLGAQPYLGLTTQIQELERGKAELLKKYSGDIFEKMGAPVPLNFFHRTGILVDAINEFENAVPPPNLLIIGKRGEGANMAKAHLGSNMERVVRASKLPCLIANREFFKPQKVMLAYDGSSSATRALHWCATKPASLNDTELHIVSVAKSGEQKNNLLQLREAEKVLETAGVNAICQMLTGIPAEAIATYQQSQDINFLLMGAYGHSRIRRLFIGSTTTELLQQCRIPIMLFR